MKPQKTHRKWSKFPFEQQVGIKLAAGGCHSPELDVQPRLAVEWWEVFQLMFPAHPAPGTSSRGSTESCHLSCPCPASYRPRRFCCLWTAPHLSSTQSLLCMWPLGSCMCAVQKNMWPLCVSREWHLFTSDLQNIISRRYPGLQLKFSIRKFLLALLFLPCCWCLEDPNLGSWCFVALMFWTMCFASHLMPYCSFEGIRCCNSRT